MKTSFEDLKGQPWPHIDHAWGMRGVHDLHQLLFAQSKQLLPASTNRRKGGGFIVAAQGPGGVEYYDTRTKRRAEENYIKLLTLILQAMERNFAVRVSRLTGAQVAGPALQAHFYRLDSEFLARSVPEELGQRQQAVMYPLLLAVGHAVSVFSGVESYVTVNQLTKTGFLMRGSRSQDVEGVVPLTLKCASQFGRDASQTQPPSPVSTPSPSEADSSGSDVESVDEDEEYDGLEAAPEAEAASAPVTNASSSSTLVPDGRFFAHARAIRSTQHWMAAELVPVEL